MRNVVALDVSKGKSYYTIYANRVCLSEGEVAHDKVGLGKLNELIAALDSPPEVVYEATGVYSRIIRKFCLENNYTFFELNPLLAKNQIIGSSLRRQKNDKVDAHKLALSQFNHERVPFAEEDKIYTQLRTTERLYQDITKQLTRAKNHLHASLTLTFPEINVWISEQAYSLYNVKIINQYPHSDFVHQASVEDICAMLRSFTKKSMSPGQFRNKADKLIDFARDSYPITDVNDMEVESTLTYARQVIFLEEEKLRLIKIKDELAQKLSDYEIFRSLPGIGKVTAAGLMAELGDLRRFETSKQLNAFVGIDLRSYQSGQYVGSDSINKRGNRYARLLLYQAIKSMIKHQKQPNHIVDYYYKLKRQPRPKLDKVAIVACMNKLLKCLHSQVSNGNLYDYSYTVSRTTVETPL